MFYTSKLSSGCSIHWIQHFQAHYSVTFATVNVSTFIYYLQLWSSEAVEFFRAKWCTKGSLIPSCTPSKPERAFGNSGQYFGTYWHFIMECWNTNQIADSSINCIFTTGISCVLKINLTSRSSRLLSANPLILSLLKYIREKFVIYCLCELNQTKFLVSLSLSVVSCCDLVVVASVWRLGGNVKKYRNIIEYFCY